MKQSMRHADRGADDPAAQAQVWECSTRIVLLDILLTDEAESLQQASRAIRLRTRAGLFVRIGFRTRGKRANLSE